MIREDLLVKLAKPVSLEDLGLNEYDVPSVSPRLILNAGKKMNTYGVTKDDIDYADLSNQGAPVFDYAYKPTYDKYRAAGIDPELGTELASHVYDNRPNAGYEYKTPKLKVHDPETDAEWQSIAKKRMLMNYVNRAKGGAITATVGAGLGYGLSNAIGGKFSKPLSAIGTLGGALVGQWAANKDSNWIKGNREALQEYGESYVKKSPEFKAYAGDVIKNVAKYKDTALQDADEAIRVYKDLRSKGKIKDSEIKRDIDGVYDVPAAFQMSKFNPYKRSIQ